MLPGTTAVHIGKPIDLSDIATPALLVDHQRLRKNIDDMATRASDAGAALWPHAKTHKSREVALLQQTAGAAGITVATLAEAEHFARAGFERILVAYPPIGRWRQDWLATLASETRLSVALEHPAAAQALDRLCRDTGVSIHWLWEVDCGTRRLGTPPGRPTANAVAHLADKLRHAQYDGLFTFAGHAYQATSREHLAQIAAAERDALLETADCLAELGIDSPTLSRGTTPTAHFMGPADRGLQVRPGNYVFHDATQVALEVVSDEACALSVLSTVISRPDRNRIVVDAGSKALAAERMNNRTSGFGRVIGHPDLLVERLFEEHGIVTSTSDIDIAAGTRVRIIPNHACAAANLHASMLITEGDAIVDEWKVAARGWKVAP